MNFVFQDYVFRFQTPWEGQTCPLNHHLLSAALIPHYGSPQRITVRHLTLSFTTSFVTLAINTCSQSLSPQAILVLSSSCLLDQSPASSSLHSPYPSSLRGQTTSVSSLALTQFEDPLIAEFLHIPHFLKIGTNVLFSPLQHPITFKDFDKQLG